MHTYRATFEKHENSLSSAIVPVPDDIASSLIEVRDDKRVVCNINGEHSYHCALMPDGKDGYYIMVNKQVLKKVDGHLGQQVQIELSPDPTKYGMPVPEEFKEVIHTDPEGEVFFKKLSPGKQRSLLHIVGKVKSSDLRITKSLIIVEHLKRMKGELDYKVLYQDLKRGK